MVQVVSASGHGSIESGTAAPSLLRPLQEATELLVGWSIADHPRSRIAGVSPSAGAPSPSGATPPTLPESAGSGPSQGSRAGSARESASGCRRSHGAALVADKDMWAVTARAESDAKARASAPTSPEKPGRRLSAIRSPTASSSSSSSNGLAALRPALEPTVYVTPSYAHRVYRGIGIAVAASALGWPVHLEGAEEAAAGSGASIRHSAEMGLLRLAAEAVARESSVLAVGEGLTSHMERLLGLVATGASGLVVDAPQGAELAVSPTAAASGSQADAAQHSEDLALWERRRQFGRACLGHWIGIGVRARGHVSRAACAGVRRSVAKVLRKASVIEETVLRAIGAG